MGSGLKWVIRFDTRTSWGHRIRAESDFRLNLDNAEEPRLDLDRIDGAATSPTRTGGVGVKMGIPSVFDLV